MGTFNVSARIVSVETGEIVSTSDFDIRGELDDMLSFGMKIVALILTGNDEEAKRIESSYVERRNMRFTDRTAGKRSGSLLLSTSRGKYLFEGQTLTDAGVKDVLLSLNDENVNQLVSEYNRLNVSGLLISIVGGIPFSLGLGFLLEEPDIHPAVGRGCFIGGGYMLTSGLIRGTQAPKKLREAIVRYNRVVAA